MWRCAPDVLLGEGGEAQKEYLLHLLAELNPRGVLEQGWVEDVFDHIWNLMRYRNLKTALLNAAAYQGLQRILTPLIGATDAVALAIQWHAKDANAIAEVDDILRSAGLSFETVMAQALAIKLPEIEAIDRLIAEKEGQRNAALRELDRHRALLGQEGAGQLSASKMLSLRLSTKATGDKPRNDDIGSVGRQSRQREKSTGPKTFSGKRRSARNARKLGLSIPVAADSTLAVEVSSLAAQLARNNPDRDVSELATKIAEARAMRSLLARLSSQRPSAPRQVVIENARNSTICLAQDHIAAQSDRVAALSQAADQLAVIARYERRALSRRKLAIRQFDEIVRREKKVEDTCDGSRG